MLLPVTKLFKLSQVKLVQYGLKIINEFEINTFPAYQRIMETEHRATVVYPNFYQNSWY